jgi:hypothetical protein
LKGVIFIKTTQIATRLTEEEKKILEAYCKENDLSIS